MDQWQYNWDLEALNSSPHRKDNLYKTPRINFKGLTLIKGQNFVLMILCIFTIIIMVFKLTNCNMSCSKR